jgi:uncharacterized SAM-binding protein YcdF (DUF218 family)
MIRAFLEGGRIDAVPVTRRRRRWPAIAAGLAAALVVFCAATARLFIWPASGMPAHVDAIVMLAGPGDRLPAALRLAREHRAPVLVVSRGFDGYGGPCPPPVPRVRLICFEPSPASTRGEAEFASRLARKDHWHSVTLVTTTPQDSRARQRMQRCFGGHVYVVTVGVPWLSWPGQIAYEWAATVKMVAWQRGC